MSENDCGLKDKRQKLVRMHWKTLGREGKIRVQKEPFSYLFYRHKEAFYNPKTHCRNSEGSWLFCHSVMSWYNFIFHYYNRKSCFWSSLVNLAFIWQKEKNRIHNNRNEKNLAVFLKLRIPLNNLLRILLRNAFFLQFVTEMLPTVTARHTPLHSKLHFTIKE